MPCCSCSALGAWGVVYRAHDGRLERDVAIKLVRRDREDQRRIVRLLREAQAMALVNHPNVLPVYASGKHDGRVYIVMEFVDGAALDHWLALPRPRSEILEVFRQAGEGLQAAHDAGLVHRDFKPANVLVGNDGRVRVGDFGLARPAHSSANETDDDDDDAAPSGTDAGLLFFDLTAPGAVAGTRAYMPPEQAAGGSAGARSDQYAFCIALWEALFGARPLPPSSASADRAAPPSAEDLPAGVFEALQRGLRADPTERHPSLRPLIAALQPPPRKRPTAVLVVGAAGLVGVLAWLATRPSSACDDEALGLAEVWSPPARARVREALSQHSAVAAQITDAHLDAYAASWTSARSRACAAARATDESDDFELVCFSDARRAFAATVAALADADDSSARNAVTMARGLPRLDRCEASTARSDRAPPPATVLAYENLAAARAMIAADRREEGAELAADALTLARETGHTPLIADAELVVGHAARAQGDYDTAIASMEAAFFTAREADHTRTATVAALDLMLVFTKTRVDRNAAAEWARHARAGLDVEPEPALDVKLIAYSARLRWEREGPKPAMAGALRALQAARELPGRAEVELAEALELAVELHRELGQLDEALALARERIDVTVSAYGPAHPALGMALSLLGTVHRQRGEHDAAVDDLTRAVAQLEHAAGAEHPQTIAVRANLAASLQSAGRLTQALEVYERVLPATKAIVGPDDPRVARLVFNMGELRRMAGDLTGAEADLLAAVNAGEAALGPDHPDVALMLTSLGACQRQASSGAAAIATLQRAVSILDPPTEQPFLAGQAKYQLARAMWDAGERRDEAHELATEARELLRSDPRGGTLADEAGAWLETVAAQ